MGRGQGGRASEEKTDVGFKVEKAKVHTGKGKIIGQFLVDGEQVKGSVSKEMTTIASAAEREATEAVNRDRIPRQYQKSVKEYFSSVTRLLNGGKEKKPADASKRDEPAESSDSSDSGEKSDEDSD